MSPSDHVSNTDYHEWLKKENMDNVNQIFQATRNDPNAVRILKKMAEHFQLPGKHPHHTRATAVALVRALVAGELDVVDESGKGFWHEEGYEKHEQ